MIPMSHGVDSLNVAAASARGFLGAWKEFSYVSEREKNISTMKCPNPHIQRFWKKV